MLPLCLVCSSATRPARCYDTNGCWYAAGVAKKHPRKQIEEVIAYAVHRGWRFAEAGPRAHLFGTLRCPEASRDGCVVRIASTPRDADNHASRIRKAVGQCPHRKEQ